MTSRTCDRAKALRIDEFEAFLKQELEENTHIVKPHPYISNNPASKSRMAKASINHSNDRKPSKCNKVENVKQKRMPGIRSSKSFSTRDFKNLANYESNISLNEFRREVKKGFYDNKRPKKERMKSSN